MNNMITIDEAIQANNRVIGICFMVFILVSIIAWVATIRRERRMRQRIQRAVTKAETRTRERTQEECHEKALENFIRWMEALRELRKTKAELDQLRRKYNLLYQAAEGCPGVTAGKIEN